MRNRGVSVRRARWWIAAASVGLVAALLFGLRTSEQIAVPAPEVRATPRVRTVEVVSADELETSPVEPSTPPLRRLRVSADNAIPMPEEMLALPGETHFWTAPLLEPEAPTYTQNDPDWTLEEWNDPDFFAGRDPTQE